MARIPKFVDVFHASRSEVPPHRNQSNFASQDHLTVDDAKNMEDTFSESTGGNIHGRLFSKDVLFTGPPEQAADFGSSRPFYHHYRIPSEAIDPLTYGDDDAHSNELPSPTAGDAPGLFTTIPLTRRHVVAAGRVYPMVNNAEGTNAESPVSHVIPIHKMDALGIKHMGVYSGEDIENFKDKRLHELTKRGIVSTSDMSTDDRRLFQSETRFNLRVGEALRQYAGSRHGRINDMVNLIRHPEEPVEVADVQKNGRLEEKPLSTKQFQPQLPIFDAPAIPEEFR